ncbi:MAG: hypothetical protein FWF91_01730 [Coriobacteriia bacterium]|nr:hypothetical protein [Coriobacteriia bacterium]
MTMKTEKAPRWPLITLTIVFLAFAALYLTFIATGYVLVPFNRLAPAVLSTVITATMVLLSVMGVKKGRSAERKPILLAALLPLCAIVFVLGKALGYDTDGIELYLLPLYAIIALTCSMAVFFTLVSVKPLRIWLGAVYSVIMVIMFLWLLIWDFSPQPVIKAEVSPSATYKAEVLLSNQGSLSKNALVYVTPQGQDIPLAIGMLRKAPQQVYKGDYDSPETLTLHWESDTVLIVNEERITLR